MRITFQLHYRTVWGEELKVILPHTTVSLGTADGYLWSGSTDMPDCRETVVPYYYGVYVQGKCVRREWHVCPHVLYLNTAEDHEVCDNWRDIPQEAYFFSDAFDKRQGKLTLPPLPQEGRFLLFRATCSMLPGKGMRLAVCGNQEVLGNWQPDKAIPLFQVAPHQWVGAVSTYALPIPFEYKFLCYDVDKGTPLYWEVGKNRQWQYLPSDNRHLILPETDVCFDAPKVRMAGTAIPVFSLRSEKSFGVGDFGDLMRLADWAELTGQRVIQLLPINDTTTTRRWTDSYPYKAISIYALHPMYADLNQVGALKNRKQQSRFDALRQKLNALPDVDYEQVNKAKEEFLRLKFAEEGAKVLASEEFSTFFRQNEDWLMPYSAYCYLRDLYHTPDCSQWGEYSSYDTARVRQLCSSANKESYPAISYYYYVQYLLHNQLLKAASYVRSKGILLKGDIPIGVHRQGVETWMEPDCFHLNGQAGAPPDAFSVNGQNWGFPTYNWDMMERTHYLWWQKRFAKMAEYFTAYRIDHILGFFRIWEIPIHAVHGLLGQFVPSLPFSPQEIESFGLPFRESFVHPYIDEQLLDRTFGTDKAWIKDLFVRPSSVDSTYEMRPEFATQRQVQAYFEGKTDGRSIRLREGLYSLISNVLFVPDRNRANRYHPRIDAQNDYYFSVCLNRKEKEAFLRLHNHYFYERHNKFWREEAMKKLPTLTQCTRMLACGEDLGMIPSCVPGVMEELHILSLEVERMPKDSGCEFGRTERYPYPSVATLSTHDTSTLRGWWKENSLLTEHYYHEVLHRAGRPPKEADGALCREMVAHILASPSMLCILTFQDWLSMDESLRCPDIDRERINVPANPLNYWHYRMHLTLEQLMDAHALNQQIRSMVEDSGRSL